MSLSWSSYVYSFTSRKVLWCNRLSILGEGRPADSSSFMGTPFQNLPSIFLAAELHRLYYDTYQCFRMQKFGRRHRANYESRLVIETLLLFYADHLSLIINGPSMGSEILIKTAVSVKIVSKRPVRISRAHTIFRMSSRKSKNISCNIYIL